MKDHNSRKPWFRPVVVTATCVCLIAALIPIMGQGSPSSSGPGKHSSDSSGLYKFSSYKELASAVRDVLQEQQNRIVTISEGSDELSMSGDTANTTGPGMSTFQDSESTKTPQAGSSAPVPNGDPTDGAPSHSNTYTQVDGVDEADIVKTDGRFIYYVSTSDDQLIIASAADGKTARVGTIKATANNRIHDIYVKDDRLIMICNTSVLSTSESSGDASEESGIVSDPLGYSGSRSIPATAVEVYDITNRATPLKTGRYIQNGSLISSRMTEDNLILVSRQSIYGYDDIYSLPAVSFDDEAGTALDISDIRCIPSPSVAAYTIAGIINTEDGKLSEKHSDVKAVLGGSEEIYCNDKELYITAELYDDPGSKRRLLPQIPNEPGQFDEDVQTQVLRATFSKGNVAFASLTQVPGRVNDQFSMDSGGGYFKIATTSRDGGKDVNNLFVLDKKLNKTGSIRNFARNEHIEAVRYIGDYAYVITYEETDPLFIIDLKDPTDPEIKGHVKISGFSTLLIPVDKDHILGFGFSTETVEGGEATNGLKLALFDVSDPTNPKVADSASFANLTSAIQYDHKALLVGQDAGYYAIPYDHYYPWIEDAEIDAGSSDADKPDNGIMIIDADGGKIKILNDLPAATSIRRCIYIGDWIYGIGTNDSIQAFSTVKPRTE